MRQVILKIIKITFLTFLLISLLAGCGNKSNDTIKIGVATVETGSDGELGRGVLTATQIAVDEWNARGGLLGKKIVLVSRDDEGKPDKAVTVAQDLVNAGVVGVIGNFNSGCTIPSSTIFAQRKIVQITPASTNPNVTDRGIQTIFRTVGRDDQQGKVAAEFIYQKLGLKKIAILNDKSAYGEGIAQEVGKTFKSLGGEVVIDSGVGKNELDFRANISAIKTSGAEALFFGGLYGQSGPLVVQMREGGLKIPFVSGDGTMVQDFLNTAGSNATEVYFTFGPDYNSMPSAQEFLQKYRKKYGPEGPYAIYSYVASNVLFQAIQTAGVTDGDKVASTIRATHYDTPMGPVDFDAKGDLKVANFVIWTVKDGKFMVLQ